MSYSLPHVIHTESTQYKQWRMKELLKVHAGVVTSSLAKGYDPLYSSSPLASLDGFSRSHGDTVTVYM